MNSSNLCFIGTGYVGLVTGSAMASVGHQVTCLDIDQRKIDNLTNSKIPFYEPGLEELVRKAIQANHLSFTTDYKTSVLNNDVFFICVDTPPSDDGSANLSSVKKVAQSIATYMSSYKVIVNKSTVPPGTAEVVKETIQSVLNERKVSIPFDVVSNPEFLSEGTAIANCMKPDRVILGVENEKSLQVMQDVYSPLKLSEKQVVVMNIRSAEMTKYSANIMLASRISLMNELAGLSELLGADIDSVREGIGLDPRIGSRYIYPGIGFGGSCLPKELKAIQAIAKNRMYATPLITSIETVNQLQKEKFVTKIVNYFDNKGGVAGKTLGILGLSFKPGTDDMREAPSIYVISKLQSLGVNLQLFDPVAMPNASRVIEDDGLIMWCKSELEAAKNADGLVLVTNWKQFKTVDLSGLLEIMRGKAFFDGRNLFSPHLMSDVGFDYLSIGKQAVYSKI